MYDPYGWMKHGAMGLCIALGAFLASRGIRGIALKRIERSYRSGTYYYGRDAIALGSVQLMIGLATLMAVVYALIDFS